MHAHLISLQAAGDQEAPPPDAFDLVPVDGGPSRRIALVDAAPADCACAGAGYEVEDVMVQPGAPAAGTYVDLVEFDGPRSAEQVASDRRSGRDRIWPASAQVAGTVGAIVLRARDGGMVVLALADSPASIQQAHRAILSTPLLPGEDPALLGEPDRSGIHRLDGDDATALFSAARRAAVTA